MEKQIDAKEFRSMKDIDTRNRVIEKALELGACMVGITTVALIKKSPSHLIYGKLDEYKGVGTRHPDETELKKRVKYCRRCETTCPVGKPEKECELTIY